MKQQTRQAALRGLEEGGAVRRLRARPRTEKRDRESLCAAPARVPIIFASGKNGFAAAQAATSNHILSRQMLRP